MDEVRHEQLKREFEHQLRRPLEKREKEFLNWLVEKEKEESYAYPCIRG